jgi:hypothetical protein
VRVDEGRREHEPGAVDHAVAVCVKTLAKRGDDASVHTDVEHRVHALDRVEHPRTSDDQVVVAAVLAVEHQATSSGSAASTGTGPVVSRS